MDTRHEVFNNNLLNIQKRNEKQFIENRILTNEFITGFSEIKAANEGKNNDAFFYRLLLLDDMNQKTKVKIIKYHKMYQLVNIFI